MGCSARPHEPPKVAGPLQEGILNGNNSDGPRCGCRLHRSVGLHKRQTYRQQERLSRRSSTWQATTTLNLAMRQGWVSLRGWPCLSFFFSCGRCLAKAGYGSLGAWVGTVSSGPVLYAIGRRVPVVVWLTIAMKMTVSVRLWSGPPLGPPSSHLKQFLTLLGTLIVRRVYGTMGPLLRAFLSVVGRGGQIGRFMQCFCIAIVFA